MLTQSLQNTPAPARLEGLGLGPRVEGLDAVNGGMGKK